MKKIKIITVALIVITLLVILLTNVSAQSYYVDDSTNRADFSIWYFRSNDNIYCIERTQSQSYNKTVPYRIRTKVVIKGDEAKFYTKNSNGVYNLSKTVNSSANNIIGFILTKSNVDGRGNSYVNGGQGSYYQVGYMNASGWTTDAQLTLWGYFNTWIDACGINGSMGFSKYSGNAAGETANHWLPKAYELTQKWNYNVTFYLAKCDYGDWQDAIIVDPKDPEPKEEKIDIPVTKKWVDGNDSVGARPKDVTVKLFANGEDTGKTVKLNKDNNWKNTFTELDKKDESGNIIKYTIKEEGISKKYEAKITGNQEKGFTITNKLKIELTVTKKWSDLENFDDIRPATIKVKLFANGNDTGKSVTLNASNKWTAKFTELYKYDSDEKEITYTVQEEDITGYVAKYDDSVDSKGNIKFVITNTHNPSYEGYIEIKGKVWADGFAGKQDKINGTFDSNEKGIAGVKVILKDKNGNQFDATSTAVTDKNGTYTIKVNYDNSKNVYKLYENSAKVFEKLKTAYVEFEYDGLKYTTVANAASKEANKTSSANKSKAIEKEEIRNKFDSTHHKVTSTTAGPDAWTDKIVTASTQNVISFGSYEDKTTRTSKEVLRYCNGNGTYTRTNHNNAWEDVITNNHTCTKCNSKGHTLREHDISVEVIQNVNLGLFEKEQPDVAIFSDISKVKVTMQGQEYTYLYNVRSNEKNNVGLKVKFEEKGTYTYKRPVNPADIAYINKTNNNVMSVEVTYEVTLANLSTTLPVTIHDIANYYDSRYTLTTTGWKQSKGEKFNVATNNGDLNITLKPGTESEKIELTYTVSLEAIKGLLNENATLNNAVEIQSYSTKYGEKTLYAEQKTGGRTDKPYGGYDYDSHPGNAGIKVDKNGKLSATKLEDDTDIAPSFLLCKDEDYYKILSGNVWEDSDANAKDNYRLGNGKKDKSDKNVEKVKVELLKVKDDGTLEIAQLYYLDTKTAEIKTKDAVTYTDKNGNYAFGDKKYGVVVDKYVIKFTYGTGIDGATISARDYKSTIISAENANIYNLFKGTNSSEEWHLNTSKGYSIAVDTIEERVAISDLQYSNFDEKINITALSKPFAMQVEFDPSTTKTTSVDANGKTSWTNELNIFDFGIIERAREDIFAETTIEYLKVTLANGQVLTEGDPRVDELNYAKPIGFNQNINNGTAARNALEKQVLVEIDPELIQGAELAIKYAIKVTNNSEKDIEYYIEGTTPQYKTEYYYFGTNNEKSPEINTSVNYVIDYLDNELTYTWENAEEWTQKTAEELLNEGLISKVTHDSIKEKEYVSYISTKFSNLKPGESMTDHITAKKLLSNQDENVYDNHAEILKIDAKTARTIKETRVAKEYKMGNYVPSLATRVISNDTKLEKTGLHEQDDDRLKVVITPPTGTTNYIATYIITGFVGLIVIAVVVIFIKKKVLTK